MICACMAASETGSLVFIDAVTAVIEVAGLIQGSMVVRWLVLLPPVNVILLLNPPN